MEKQSGKREFAMSELFNPPPGKGLLNLDGITFSECEAELDERGHLVAFRVVMMPGRHPVRLRLFSSP